MPRRFTRSARIAAPADEVFAWHTRPGAFERLVPPWERVRVVSRTGGIEDGSRLVLEMRAGPLRLHWVARHRDVVAGCEFTDEQLSGPFAEWVHRHRVVAHDAESCDLVDDIEYALPLDALSSWTAPITVVPRLERMFRYRHAVTRDDVELHAAHRHTPRLRVGVTGASGLIGSHLVPLLTTGGHSVVRLVRHDVDGHETRRWQPTTGLAADAGPLDAVVHLAGASVSARRWTAAWKEEIRESRVSTTRALAESIARWPTAPRTLVCASAIGFYGHRGNEIVDESSDAGGGFLAEVCREWEAAAAPALDAGIRVIWLRFGIVLSPRGGALATMLPAFLTGLGGRVGTGRQMMSWVSIDDAVGAIVHALCRADVTGPMNVTAPAPVSQQALAATVAHVLRRPALGIVPAPLLRWRFGEFAEEILSGADVRPTAIVQSGYRFRHASLESALRHLLGR